MKKFLIILIFICLTFVSKGIAQIDPGNPMHEAPLRIQTWFYEHYQNAPDVSWSRKNLGSEIFHEAHFKLKGKYFTVLLDDSGKIREEVVVNKKPILTSGIKIYIDQNYSKFKLAALKSVKIFTNDGDYSTYYELMGKDRQEQVSFWYNESNKIINRSDVALVGPFD